MQANLFASKNGRRPQSFDHLLLVVKGLSTFMRDYLVGTQKPAYATQLTTEFLKKMALYRRRI
jgi:hypothetical protein